MNYYLYNTIPNTHPTWMLAVLAVSQADADEYIRIYNGGGKRAGMVERGKVRADCGAVTSKAEKELSNGG